MNLQEYLKSTRAPEDLQTLILAVSAAVVDIANAISGGNVSKVGTMNESGEEQLALDVKANEILFGVLKDSGIVKAYASEEFDGAKPLSKNAKYLVASDPLDGSSLVDVNLAVGTIVGIYEGEDFVGMKGSDQSAALVANYGPRTTIILTVKEGTHEFLFNGEEFIMSREDLKVADEGKMFAPGNLRAAKFDKKYLELVNFWAENQYKLRYSGGMVPDIAQIMLKGYGIFTYPGYEEQPNGKLRLLYECAPQALLMEQAGGVASDGGIPILDKDITELHQRTPIFIGSKKEVEKALQILGHKNL